MHACQSFFQTASTCWHATVLRVEVIVGEGTAFARYTRAADVSLVEKTFVTNLNYLATLYFDDVLWFEGRTFFPPFFLLWMVFYAATLASLEEKCQEKARPNIWTGWMYLEWLWVCGAGDKVFFLPPTVFFLPDSLEWITRWDDIIDDF